MKKIIINENQRGFLFKNGKYEKMLKAGQTYDIYRTVVRELLSSSARTSPVKVLANDKIRYSIYKEGDVYLLNTDFDIPGVALIEANGKKEYVTLNPCEIKHIKI